MAGERLKQAVPSEIDAISGSWSGERGTRTPRIFWGLPLEKSLDDFLVAAKLLDISPDERLYNRQEYTVRAPLLKEDRT